MELWRSDGTDPGTYMVKDINLTIGLSSSPNEITDVGGAVLGRLLGLSRTLTITAVLVGSTLCAGMMYSGSGLVREWIKPDAMAPKVVAVSVVVVVIYVLNQRYRAAMKRLRARKERREQTSDGADRP